VQNPQIQNSVTKSAIGFAAPDGMNDDRAAVTASAGAGHDAVASAATETDR